MLHLKRTVHAISMAGTNAHFLGQCSVALQRLALVCLALISIYMLSDLRARQPLLSSIKFRPDYLPKLPSAYDQDLGQVPFPLSAAGYGAPSEADLSCRNISGADRVMVLMKTGATELYQKLPTHFVTTFKCVTHLNIYSDLAQTIGEIPIHDAIAPVSELYRQQHADFELYRRLEKWRSEGQDMSKLMGKSGWNLDKWKFLPMLHHAFESASDEIDWFVVMEADTSISWSNLLLWLKTMDPTKPLYIGSQNMIGTTYFAHGGSGIVISRGAAEILKTARQNAGPELYDGEWEAVTAASCCGDEVVARAFLAVDIPLSPGWPLIQGETISTVDWTTKNWCAPPITWHHVAATEVDSYWKFQLNWARRYGWEEPYLYRDIFAEFIEPHISVNRALWNNLSKDRRLVAAALASADDESSANLEGIEAEAVGSESACAVACVQAGAADCVQWMFTPGRCYLGKKLRFGQSDETDNEHWTSGWIQDRVEALVRSMEGCAIRWSG